MSFIRKIKRGNATYLAEVEKQIHQDGHVEQGPGGNPEKSESLAPR
jgi:hypothetical protein